jgi:DUF2934 family protein
MAKRPGTRSQADDRPTSAPTQPRARRARTAPAAVPAQSAGSAVGQMRPVELDPEPALRRELSPWHPSEEEIRVRAYHRFLERGATHGQAFDDWIQAERDLKLRG